MEEVGSFPDGLCALWTEEQAGKWHAFWSKVLVQSQFQSTEGSLLQWSGDRYLELPGALLNEYMMLQNATNPYARLQHEPAARRHVDALESVHDYGEAAREIAHMWWTFSMMCRSMPRAFADIDQRGVLAGEGGRLLHGSRMLGNFASLANQAAREFQSPNHVEIEYIENDVLIARLGYHTPAAPPSPQDWMSEDDLPTLSLGGNDSDLSSD